MLTSSLVASQLQFQLNAAASAPEAAGSSTNPFSKGLSKYIRQKQLDPLETYVPLVLEARTQLLEAGQVMLSDVPAGRQLLRTGALNGVRDNVKALGEYAIRNGRASTGRELVTRFFSLLEDFDLLLASTIRSSNQLPVSEAETKLGVTVAALDVLIATVPSDVLEKSNQMLSATRSTVAVDASSSEYVNLEALLP